MANNLYMPLHPVDYLTDTVHLTTAEHGAYLLLIMNYWQRGGALPADDKKLRGATRMSPDEWAASRNTILDFFEERDGNLYHKRIDAEIATAKEKSEKARANAKLSHSGRIANAKRTQSDGRASAKRTQSECLANQDQEQEQEQKEPATAASSAGAKPAFEIECRNLVGEEPVVVSLDFHKLQNLVESGAVTETDVKDGIRSAMAKPDFRIRHWSQLEGWARGAAKARMETRAKASGAPIVVSMTPEARTAALAKSGTRWVEYDTAEWSRVADLWKAEKATYPPHPSGGWYFPESYFALSEAAA